MSSYMVTTNTIDLIVQAAYKYRAITKMQRTQFGQQLWAANQQSLSEQYQDEPAPTFVAAMEAYPAFTPFPRKFRRVAVSGAISTFTYQACDAESWANSEVKRILDRVAEKNAVKSGYFADTEFVPEYDEDGDELYDEYDEPVGTTRVVKTAAAKMVEANRDAEPRFGDVSDAMRDPESEDYESSVMVRPIEIIRAEREAEAERIRAERMAATAERHAAELRADNDDADDEDDDWDLDDEDDDDA